MMGVCVCVCVVTYNLRRGKVPNSPPPKLTFPVLAVNNLKSEKVMTAKVVHALSHPRPEE
jgi:hypothetical protein